MHFLLPKEYIHGHVIDWKQSGTESQKGFVAFDFVNSLSGDAIELSIDFPEATNFVELFFFEMLDEVSI
jgi:hypothetical protein